MRFLVTGATSGLGRNAVEWLLAEGHQVHATGRDKHIGKQLIALGACFTALDLVHATDEDYKNLLIDCDIVWHCAALSSPWGKYEWFYQANVLVTSRFSYWAGILGIKRFIHVSTPSIYFDFKSHINLSENYLAKPFANHYAATKYEAEQIIQQQVKAYPNTIYIIIRPRGLFGPYDRVIVPRVLTQLKRTKGILYLPSGGKAYIDLTFVLNVVYALFLATTNTILNSGDVFNITNQQPCHLKQMLEQLLKDRLQIQYKIRALPYHFLYAVSYILELIASLTQKEPLLTRYSVGTLYFDMTLSQDLAMQRLGYTPKYTLADAMDITAQWLQQQELSNNG